MDAKIETTKCTVCTCPMHAIIRYVTSHCPSNLASRSSLQYASHFQFRCRVSPIARASFRWYQSQHFVVVARSKTKEFKMKRHQWVTNDRSAYNFVNDPNFISLVSPHVTQTVERQTNETRIVHRCTVFLDLRRKKKRETDNRSCTCREWSTTMNALGLGFDFKNNLRSKFGDWTDANLLRRFSLVAPKRHWTQFRWALH